MFNRFEIFKAAWKMKRFHPRYSFGTGLKDVWFKAKMEGASRSSVVRPAKVLPPADAQRAATTRAELDAMNYRSFIDWNAHRNLSAELARLTA